MQIITKQGFLFAFVMLSFFARPFFAWCDGLTGEADTALREHSKITPRICVGHREPSVEGNIIALNNPNCPDGFAFYADFPRAESILSSASKIAIEGVCCELPASDILTEEHTQVSKSCPENMVATGADFRKDCNGCEKMIRCTRINTSRYQLGEAVPGVYFGFGAPYYFERMKFLLRDIPVAIRYALGRRGLTDWYSGGCIGYPFGNLFVGKLGKNCSNQIYRQLQFRGSEGDPPKGTPVPMYPECEDISDIYSENPECLRSSFSETTSSSENP